MTGMDVVVIDEEYEKSGLAETLMPYDVEILAGLW